MRAAAGFAVIAGAASAASAQLVYEPFAYSPSSALDGKVNPGNAQAWSAMSADTGDDDILLSGSNLSYAGLAGSTGASVTYAGAGKSERLAIGPVISSGIAYYSMMLQVSTLGGMTTTPVFVAGFNNRTGAADVQPTTIGTRLYLRQAAGSTPGAPTFNVGVSKNSSNPSDIAFDTTEYAINTPLFLVGSYKINGVGAGTDDEAKLYINPTALGAESAPTVSSPTAPILAAPIAGTDLLDGAGPSVASFVLRQATASVPGVQVDELRVDSTWAQVTPPVGVAWTADSDGSWSEDAKWSTSVRPDSADAFVNFPAVTSAPRTVTVDFSPALRTINFTSPTSYTLAGNQALNFSASAAINVMAGSHTISTPITLGGDFLASVRSGSVLTLSADIAAGGFAVRKAGAGTLQLKNVRASRLDVLGGVVRVLPDGATAGTSKLGAITVAAGAQFDLANNKLVTQSPIGSWNGSGYTGVAGLIQSGRNGGAWNGSGIITSQSAALTGASFTTLGSATASQAKGIATAETTLWAGQTITGSDTLVMYTYGGDANLDGRINVDDYTRIDFNVPLSSSGWYNGDFNYDGKINIDDYTIIDFNVGIQGAPFSNSGAVSAVPEPFLLAPIGLLAALRRRRR
jgi:hypothetical protein